MCKGTSLYIFFGLLVWTDAYFTAISINIYWAFRKPIMLSSMLGSNTKRLLEILVWLSLQQEVDRIDTPMYFILFTLQLRHWSIMAAARSIFLSYNDSISDPCSRLGLINGRFQHTRMISFRDTVAIRINPNSRKSRGSELIRCYKSYSQSRLGRRKVEPTMSSCGTKIYKVAYLHMVLSYLDSYLVNYSIALLSTF